MTRSWRAHRPSHELVTERRHRVTLVAVVSHVARRRSAVLCVVVAVGHRVVHGRHPYTFKLTSMSRGNTRTMRIGDVARDSGLSPTTTRYYEDIGLVPEPARAANGYRDYEPSVVERLRFISDAQESGLTLAEIGSILELRAQGDPTCQHTIELMERYLADVERRIESLTASRDLYAKLIARAKTLDPAECTDPDRCQTIAADPDHAHAPNDNLRSSRRVRSRILA